MRTQFPATSLVVVLLSMLLCTVAQADTLAGVSDITVVDGALASIRHDGTEYVVANEDLMLGTTTRWYIPAATGVPTLWVEGVAAPAATVTGTSDPKVSDVGSKADTWTFGVAGAAGGISSIDGIDFQETIFPLPTKMIFVFERGGNDNGTVEPILADGSLGTALTLTANGAPYANTGVNVGGQNAFGYVFTSDEPVMGLRITASGHDTLSISAVPMRLDPRQSHDPQPKDEATDVPRKTILVWAPGEGAGSHDVYFGTSFEDVDLASRTDPRGVLISQGQAAREYDRGVLEFGQTYYWRVDEVLTDGSIFKGQVWSFIVESLAYPIVNITATASDFDPGAGPENTINGSGLNEENQHSVDAADMWLASPAAGEAAWIQYEFDRVHKLHELWVWNYNVQFEAVLGFGARDVTLEHSKDGTDWTTLGDYEFARATAMAGYSANTTIDLQGVAARFVRLNVNSGWGVIGQYGLSEVRFFSIPVHAKEPQPADGAAGVAPDAVLSWRAGREAVSHEVYLSDKRSAVTDGTSLIDAVGQSRYELSDLDLKLGTTYYWKVNEVNEAESIGTWEGDIWSFSTPAFFVVEDFESYTDNIDAGRTIWQTWIDGFEDTANGSQVGYLDAPFAEKAVINSGRQSMPLFYNNVGGVAYSEAQITFESPQDWTRAGAAILTLYFRGSDDNTGGQVYVKISGVKVAYDGNADAITSASWTQWNIDLASVATNLRSVRTLAIGVEGSGSGVLYVDDFRLLPGASTAAAAITIGPASSLEAAGNDGMLLSINGIDVSGLILGTTSTDFEKHAAHPAVDADNFNLGTYASLDDSSLATVMFTVPVTTIFIVERGGNDQGLIQPLDADGNPMGGTAAFAQGDWYKPGLTIEGQAAGAIVITADASIFGITILPPVGGVTGIDPACICAVPAP